MRWVLTFSSFHRWGNWALRGSGECVVLSLDTCGLRGLSSRRWLLCPPAPLWILKLPSLGSSPPPPLMSALPALSHGHGPLNCQVACASCGHEEQGAEFTGNLFSPPTVLVTLVCHSLLSREHGEAQGCARSPSQRMQVKLGLRRQLEANETDTQWLSLSLCVCHVESLGWKWIFGESFSFCVQKWYAYYRKPWWHRYYTK